MDYDDDRYYISNNIRNKATYNYNANHPGVIHQRQHSQPVVMSNFGATNRYVSHPAIITSTTEPRQDVGLPRSSIV